MLILALCGSARRQSTNLALLRALQALAPEDMTLQVFDGVGDLPVFSPDREGSELPPACQSLKHLVGKSDGLLIASPEYARGIPGGLKNAIDWLVSGDEIVDKPIALVHASHRGDDMLAALRLVLSTVSRRFAPELFLRIPVMSASSQTVQEIVTAPQQRAAAASFLCDFAAYCTEASADRPAT